MKKKMLYRFVAAGVVIICISCLLIRINNANIDTNYKFADGSVIENLAQFSTISNDEIENMDSVSKTILSNVTCEFSNVSLYDDGTGTAYISISYPDMKQILDPALDKIDSDNSILDKYDGENDMEKFDAYLVECINRAELTEKTLSVDLSNNDGQWMVVMTEELSDLLSGNIEKAYIEVYNSLEE